MDILANSNKRLHFDAGEICAGWPCVEDAEQISATLTEFLVDGVGIDTATTL